MLTEVGYQAGQHEQLSELYTKTIPHDLKTKAKQDAKLTEKYRQEIKNMQQSVEQAQKVLTKMRRFCLSPLMTSLMLVALLAQVKRT